MTGCQSGLFSYCFLPADKLQEAHRLYPRFTSPCIWLSLSFLSTNSRLFLRLLSAHCWKLPKLLAGPPTTCMAEQEVCNLSQMWQKLRSNPLPFPCLFYIIRMHMCSMIQQCWYLRNKSFKGLLYL